MNLYKSVKFHKALRKALGDDLVYSLALDEGKFYLAISVHKSDTWEYSHGRNIQTCLLTEDDIQSDITSIVNKIVPMYKAILVRKNNDVQLHKVPDTQGI